MIEIIGYVANPQKTDHGMLITGYECDSQTAGAEFLLAKQNSTWSKASNGHAAAE